MLTGSLQPSSIHPFPEQAYSIKIPGHHLELDSVSLPSPPCTRFSYLHRGARTWLSFSQFNKSRYESLEQSLEMWSYSFYFACLISVACQGKMVAWNCLKILFPFHTCIWQGKGRLGSMTNRFMLVIHPESFHLGVLPFLESSSSHSKNQKSFVLSHKTRSQFSNAMCPVGTFPPIAIWTAEF